MAQPSGLILNTDPSVIDFAQTVKQQADIVKVIEGYIRLRKAGRRTIGALPFPQGKVAVVLGPCGAAVLPLLRLPASGDVFSFVGKIENVSFPRRCGLWRQVRHSAAQAGVFLAGRGRGARQRAKLLELHETATAWFEEQCAGRKGRGARISCRSRPNA